MMMKLDYNNLLRLINETLSASRSKIVRENAFGISMGMDLLSEYLKKIAERAIELNDETLIKLLLDIDVLKEDKECKENE